MAGVDIPRLDFTNVIGAGREDQSVRGADEAATRLVLNLIADDAAAEILVRGNIDHPGLRAECDRRPVLSTPMRRTDVVGALPRPGFPIRIDVGPSSFRIEAAKHRLLHERLAFDKGDGPCAPLEEPQVTVARDVYQPLHRPAVALIVPQDRRGHLVPIPRIVWMVLVVAHDATRANVERDG